MFIDSKETLIGERISKPANRLIEIQLIERKKRRKLKRTSQKCGVPLSVPQYTMRAPAEEERGKGVKYRWA